MDSKTLLGVAAGAALAIGGMALAQRHAGNNNGTDRAAPAAAVQPAPALPPQPVDDGYADVRNVRPIVEQVTTPRKVCDQVAVTHRAPGSDNHVVGTVVGAAVGGLLGNQIGRGNGRKAATVAGAVGGGFVGHEVGVQHDANRTTTSTETRCHTVNDSSDKVTGYDVTYEYQGRTYTTRMDRDPGPRLQVQPTVTPVGMPAAAPPR
ncbi:glycine zipper 2TM domain-containing protein [Dokdonella soli]|uniref:Glycine zipper 2TM domain-containing protein n=1 Tax=Dokdonella soli TaxID=529810 RepID=A0ABP3TM50_9GAMM